MISDPEISASEIESVREARNTPCVGECNTFYAETCHACGRTEKEQTHWVTLSENERYEVWKRIINQGWRPRVGIPKREKEIVDVTLRHPK
ncbi:hypothetical protein ECAE60S_01483 [Eoetvoesiella caeni]